MPLSDPRDEVFWQQAGMETYCAQQAFARRDLATARERLLLALSWLEEIESPKERTDATH